MPYCTMIWDTGKSAHGGFPRSLLLCTSDSVWRLRPSLLDSMKKISLSWKELSPVTRHGCITMIRTAKDKAWNGGIPPLQHRRRQPSAKKVMLTLFWDMHGPMLVHFQAHGQTVNSANYCAMLQNELKPAICKKRRGMPSKNVLLHHDNAHPHTAAGTVETVQHLGFKLLQHPPYSPNLVPSDYHIFGLLKETLHCHKFTSDEEAKEEVHTWLREQLKSFFSAGIQKLVERYNKCIVLQGDYVEKWYVKLLTVTSIKAVKCILPLLFDSPS